jgi:hypothetical protein
MAKPWYRSKTLWVNLFTAGILMLESTEFTTMIPQAWMEEITLVVIMLNIALRWVTTGAVTGSAASARAVNLKGAL